MGKVYPAISDRLAGFVESQPVFFVATAPLEESGLLNCSPKGNRGEFCVLNPHTVAYLDQTGSGVETIAHLRENGRIVVMFCAFDGPPRIVRFQGTGRIVTADAAEFAALRARFPHAVGPGERSVIVIDVRRIADSCGYGVPLMGFEGHRDALDAWAERKGETGIHEYWDETNRTSIDGLPGLVRTDAD